MYIKVLAKKNVLKYFYVNWKTYIKICILKTYKITPN